MSTRRNHTYEPDHISGDVVVEVKVSLQAARGLHDALTTTAMYLSKHPSKRGYLLLTQPKLSREFLRQEMDSFHRILVPGIADRLKLVVAEAGRLTVGAESIRQDDHAILQQALQVPYPNLTPSVRARKQDEVFLLMLQQWVTGQGPLAVKWLEESAGCNYRTVSSALECLGNAIERHSDRSASLKYFPEDAWSRVVAMAPQIRSTVFYADASGQPRSFQSLLKRLHNLQRNDIAIGGVLGAKHYYGELDLVGTPRLDLCVHAPGGHMDAEFVTRLDPALQPTKDPQQPGLAVHFIRRKEPFFDRDPSGTLWADPIECLLELYTARLDLQARDFQHYLASRGRELSG